MLRIGASVTRTKPVPERTAYALCLSQVPPARRGARPTRGPCCPLLSISGGAAEGPGAGDGGALAKGNQWARAEARHGKHGFLDEAERRIGPNVFRKKEADPRCDDSEDG